MKLKEQIKIYGPFAVAVLFFVLLVLLSTASTFNVSDVLFGVAYIFLTITLIFSTFSATRKIKKPQGHRTVQWMLFGAGLLSGFWLQSAINYLF